MEVEVLQGSATGFFRTLLIIIGVIVLLRFIGQLMNARRNVGLQQKMMDQHKEFERQREEAKRGFGKTKIRSSRSKNGDQQIEDVDFEEM